MAKKVKTVKTEPSKNHEKEKGYLYILTRIYVVFILAVFPLCVGFEGYDNIILSKARVYWTASIIFLIAFLLFYLAYRLGLSKDLRPPVFWKTMSVPDWAALGFLTVMTISCILSPYKDMVFLGMQDRYDGWLSYFCMIMCYFVLSRWYEPRQSDFAMFAAGSIVICVIAYLQLYGMDFLNLYPHYFNEEGVLVDTGFSISFRSTLGNIDFIGAYVCMAVVVFGVLYVKTKGRLRFLYLAASVMNFAFAIIGDSDAGKLGILSAMALLTPHFLYKREGLGRALTLSSLWGFAYVSHHWFISNRIIPNWPEELPPGGRAWNATLAALPLKPVLAVSALALAAGIILLLPKFKAWPEEKTARILGFALLGVMIVSGLSAVEIIGRKAPEGHIIYEAREVMHGRFRDEFGSYRGYVWRKSIEMFPRQPLFGTGQDTFLRAFGKLNQSESRSILGVHYDKAHNDFIQILMCNGIFGLLSYVAFCVSMIVLSIRKAFDDRFLLVALGGVLAYLVQSFFGIDTLTVTPIYWFLLAVARGRHGNKREALQ